MSLLRFRHNPLTRFAAVVALWALVFPGLVPLLHNPAAVPPPSMPMCHVAMGAASGHHAADHVPAKAKPVCPVCQSLAGLAQGFVVPVTADLAAPYIGADAHLVVDQDNFVASPIHGAWPRGPPVLA